jgi:hypothetical protein
MRQPFAVPTDDVCLWETEEQWFDRLVLNVLIVVVGRWMSVKILRLLVGLCCLIG